LSRARQNRDRYTIPKEAKTKDKIHPPEEVEKGCKKRSRKGETPNIQAVAKNVLKVVAAVAVPRGIPNLRRYHIWAKPPPVAIGVIFEKNMFTNTSLANPPKGILCPIDRRT
jgi:hypothetical protein